MKDRSTLIVDAKVLRDLMERLLAAAGCGAEAVVVAADAFLEADLRGVGLQGLDHMPTMICGLRNGRIRPDAEPRIVKDVVAVIPEDEMEDA